MAPLKNQRHELFCRNLVEGAQRGWSASEAYIRSGYKADAAAARANASRLLTKDSVKTRLAELAAPTVKKTRATIDTLAEQFDAVFDGAMGSAQFGAAGSAAAAKSKLLGFMRDRLEVGSVGSFDACETMPQLVEALLADQSATEALETLDAMREAIELHAATHAQIIVPAADPDRHRVNETEASLALFRPTRPGRRH
jgi:hypothetical protein